MIYNHLVFHKNCVVLNCKGVRSKVEKILKGCLASIPSPSPSLKIQIMGGKVCLKCKGKTLLLKTKSLLTLPSNVLPYYLPQVNFPANNLNFH